MSYFQDGTQMRLLKMKMSTIERDMTMQR